jgi:hypothetical protein
VNPIDLFLVVVVSPFVMVFAGVDGDSFETEPFENEIHSRLKFNRSVSVSARFSLVGPPLPGLPCVVISSRSDRVLSTAIQARTSRDG